MIIHYFNPKLLTKKNRKIKIYKKQFYQLYEAITHYKDWMFIDPNIINIEILEPTLNNLKLMEEYNYVFVVKGFKSPTEFTYFNKLRYKYGVATMMYSTRCLGNEIITEALNNILNNEPLPDTQQVEKAIEENRLTNIMDTIAENKFKEKIRYKKLSEKYSIVWHRKVYELIKQHRVEQLKTIL